MTEAEIALAAAYKELNDEYKAVEKEHGVLSRENETLLGRVEGLEDEVKEYRLEAHNFKKMGRILAAITEYMNFLKEETDITPRNEKQKYVLRALRYEVEDILREVR